jgi:hypothetical protein
MALEFDGGLANASSRRDAIGLGVAGVSCGHGTLSLRDGNDLERADLLRRHAAHLQGAAHARRSSAGSTR